MPSKYAVKVYVENGIYHIYNRGVEKRKIFQDAQDYKVFLHYLKRYLTDNPEEIRPRWIKDLNTEIQLLAYCLMENHFHMLIKQVSRNSLTTFMRCVMNSYTGYFNNKYNRIGPLFQGKFKAIFIDNDNYLLHLTRYIHLNPLGHKEKRTKSDLINLIEYPYSSYKDYLKERTTPWLKHGIIIDYFKNSVTKNNSINSYKKFVENYVLGDSNIQQFTIDNDQT